MIRNSYDMGGWSTGYRLLCWTCLSALKSVSKRLALMLARSKMWLAASICAIACVLLNAGHYFHYPPDTTEIIVDCALLLLICCLRLFAGT